MNKTRAFLLVLGAFSLFSILSACQSSQEPKTEMVGAYGESQVDTPEDAAAVKKILEIIRGSKPSLAQANLKKVLKYETQIVAGRNYRTTMILTLESGEVTVTSVVYRDLQDNWSLTSLTEN